MIWWGGHIEELQQSKHSCVAKGFHAWKDIQSLSKTLEKELTHTWWIVRRLTAWAGKVPDNELPPITTGPMTKEVQELIKTNIYWDGTLQDQIENI